MGAFRSLVVAAAAATAWFRPCLAEYSVWTDPDSNITFGSWHTESAMEPQGVGQLGYTFGMALPGDSLTKDATEYIGFLRCQSWNATKPGWCGVSHGTAGQMTHALLLIAWPWEGQVQTSFRYATEWVMPGVYQGDAKLTQISSFVNDTIFEVLYRCENCFSWGDGPKKTSVSTSAKSLVFGRASALDAPDLPGCPSRMRFGFHDSGYSQYGADLTEIAHSSYSAWAALATKSVSTNCAQVPTATPTPASVSTGANPSGETASVATSATGQTSVAGTSTTSVSSSIGSSSTSASSSTRSTGTSSATASSATSNTTAANNSTAASTATVPSTSTVPSSSTVPSTVSSSTGTPASQPTNNACKPVPSNKTYDYIIVGAGAAGIPLADRLTQAGRTVLLLEKGPPSSGRWGGTMRPEWLRRTNLTRFDVPGLCNEIWHDSIGVACTDTDQMAGCVLGGGTAVNAGLWWKANPKDWNENFPNAWRATDMVAATNRVFQRIPGTTTPSMDGKLYLSQGFDVLASGLNSSGWSYVVPNDHPDQKNRVYGHTTFMFSGGERGGPLATYLVSAAQRPEFTLWMNTPARRLIRTGGHITGVELECTGGGYEGNVSVTPGTGRVIVSAGTFASAKLLLRSGIGPADQLRIVQRSPVDGPTMISNDSWIDLPVGYNLNDHVNTDAEISHPNVTFYDFYAAWDNPIPADEDKYLDNRTGILAQAAPNIGPMFWEEIRGPDGIVRQLQWTSRVEGSTPNSMIMSQYLGRGSVSRGRMTITPRLDTRVTLAPYLHNDLDREVIIKGLENLQEALKNVPNLTWITPPANTTARKYVESLPNTPAQRRANHWIGSNKMGLDDGRTGGTSVVDTNAKVYGTDNLFVVDASIFPGMVTGNPSAMIVTVAERAFDRINAFRASGAARQGAQCGGSTWNGSFQCQAGSTCVNQNATFARCERASGNGTAPVIPPTIRSTSTPRASTSPRIPPTASGSSATAPPASTPAAAPTRSATTGRASLRPAPTRPAGATPQSEDEASEPEQEIA